MFDDDEDDESKCDVEFCDNPISLEILTFPWLCNATLCARHLLEDLTELYIHDFDVHQLVGRYTARVSLVPHSIMDSGKCMIYSCKNPGAPWCEFFKPFSGDGLMPLHDVTYYCPEHSYMLLRQFFEDITAWNMDIRLEFFSSSIWNPDF